MSVQTGEDNVETEVQTEGVDTGERWTQCPPEDLRGYGGVALCSTYYPLEAEEVNSAPIILHSEYSCTLLHLTCLFASLVGPDSLLVQD